MSSTGRDIVVVGGGVIGLCSAYYLGKAGHRVTVIDRDPSRREACSDQNAGMVVPSHFIPLAAPGMISLGLKWMLNPKSPFYLRPRLEKELWQWCWTFFRHSNRRHVANSRELLRDLSLESRRQFESLADELGFSLVRRGLLMLCQSEEGLHDEAEVAKAAEEIGIEAEVCSGERLKELDPTIDMEVLGGVWFPQDCHLDPGEFLKALRNAIVAQGGAVRDREVTNLLVENDRVVGVLTDHRETLKPDEVVVATGAWSPRLARDLHLNLPMQAGKGYSFTLAAPRQLPTLCSLLKEGRVAVTPMGDRLRVAGTMEICGNDLSIDSRRLQGIIESFCRFFPAFEPEDFQGIEPWAGLRPCSPDGIPYLGRVPGIWNAIVASGHSMLGLSLGPATGRAVASLVDGETVDARMDPARFAR